MDGWASVPAHKIQGSCEEVLQLNIHSKVQPLEFATRCAEYQRFSSNMQRPASLEDQDRSCRDLAAAKGWQVLDDHIYGDAAQTGTNMWHRPGLEALIAAAKQTPRPFDVVLIDETSRLARNLADVLRIAKILEHHGVGLYFVSQRLDSRDSNFQMILTIFGMSDEQYSQRLSKKVHSGQMGRVLKGFSSGARCFGYGSEEVENDNAGEGRGRAQTLGTRQRIIDNEAVIIRRIWEAFADGRSMSAIARDLKADGIPGPRKTRTHPGLHDWNTVLISRILRRDKYVGEIVWNKTRQIQDPETGKNKIIVNGEDELVRVPAPHLRLISEELETRVAARFAVLEPKTANRRLGGLNRAHRIYLFSGLLQCGVCGGPMVITGGKQSEAAYGCRAAKYNRGCTNRLRIRADRFAMQMLTLLKLRILRPEHIDHLVARVQAEIEIHHREQEKINTKICVTEVAIERAALENKAGRLINAIESLSTEDSIGLVERLKQVQKEIRAINEAIAAVNAPSRPAHTLTELRRAVTQGVEDLLSVRNENIEKSRHVLQQYIKHLTLIPVETSDG